MIMIETLSKKSARPRSNPISTDCWLSQCFFKNGNSFYFLGIDCTWFADPKYTSLVTNVYYHTCTSVMMTSIRAWSWVSLVLKCLAKAQQSVVFFIHKHNFLTKSLASIQFVDGVNNGVNGGINGKPKYRSNGNGLELQFLHLLAAFSNAPFKIPHFVVSTSIPSRDGSMDDFFTRKSCVRR